MRQSTKRIRSLICGLLLVGLLSSFLPVQAGEEAVETENAGASSELAAGTVLTEKQAQAALDAPEDYFAAVPISDEVFARIDGKTYPEGCPVELDSLRYLQVLHYNFDHEIQVGELIVNADLSEDFLEIFRLLFDAEYEIFSMYLPEEFWTGDAQSTDTASMEANNTSAFSYRQISGGGSLSNHATGRAVDINPLQNPCCEVGSDGSLSCEIEASAPYLDRSGNLDHVITADDLCFLLFTEYGFTWGGSWHSPVDYQHFERTW